MSELVSRAPSLEIIREETEQLSREFLIWLGLGAPMPYHFLEDILSDGAYLTAHIADLSDLRTFLCYTNMATFNVANDSPTLP
jgi:hypothetical protein